eukprot:m.18006 g.18006  ORF g.18006 m.18006 type:complete len:192 (+) comp9486_c0_seq1:44-619(+)
MPIKVAMVGPPRVGKSVLANFLADNVSAHVRGDYRPTQGCRIVEVAPDGAAGSPTRGRGAEDKTVELWDISGSPEYWDCTAAIMQQCVGIIFVFNPDEEGQEKELIKWHKQFAETHGIPNERCIVFANQSSHMLGEPTDRELPTELDTVKVVNTNTQKHPDQLRETFTDFIGDLSHYLANLREQAENSILT